MRRDKSGQYRKRQNRKPSNERRSIIERYQFIEGMRRFINGAEDGYEDRSGAYEQSA